MTLTSRALDGRIAIVTGAASGIGRAIAETFVRAGARVVYADRDKAAGEAAAAATGSEAVAVDVSDSEAVAALCARTAEADGGFDIVVNVAGVQRAGLVTDLSLQDWNEQMAVNVGSCFLLAKHGVPYMRGRDGASIVNVASVAGIKGTAGVCGYSASKGAIIAFTRSLAHELGPEAIRVNSLSPGWVDTPFNDPVTGQLGGRGALEALVSTTVPLRRQGLPRELAEAALFLVDGASSYLHGHNLVVDGGLSS